MTLLYAHPVTAAFVICGVAFLFGGAIILRDDIASWLR